jgi:hypothetical protein
LSILDAGGTTESSPGSRDVLARLWPCVYIYHTTSDSCITSQKEKNGDIELWFIDRLWCSLYTLLSAVAGCTPFLFWHLWPFCLTHTRNSPTHQSGYCYYYYYTRLYTFDIYIYLWDACTHI